METTYKSVLKYLPNKTRTQLKALRKKTKTESAPVRDLVLSDSRVMGIPQQEILDWTLALACLTFVQHLESRKTRTRRKADQTAVPQLEQLARKVIDTFVGTYRDPALEISSTNFIKGFVDIALRPLESLAPETLCLNMPQEPFRNEALVEETFSQDPNWQAIKAVDPEYFETIAGAAAKASFYNSLEDFTGTIIPVDILGDLIILSKIADRQTELRMAMKIIEPVGDERRLTALESALADAIFRFDSIAQNYETLISSRDAHCTVLLLAQNFATHPTQIISRFGPGCLCAPWT